MNKETAHHATKRELLRGEVHLRSEGRGGGSMKEREARTGWK